MATQREIWTNWQVIIKDEIMDISSKPAPPDIASENTHYI